MLTKFSIFLLVGVICAAAVSVSGSNFGELHQQDHENYYHLLTGKSLQGISPDTIALKAELEFQLKEISTLLRHNEVYNVMDRKHKEAVNRMKHILAAQTSVENYFKAANFIRDFPGINRKAWIQAVQTSRLMLPTLRGLKLQHSLAETMPDIMFSLPVLERAVDNARNRNGEVLQCSVSDDTFGADNGEENKFWYFREDVFLNSHHYFWHVHEGTGYGARYGELFYFMHHEVIARYTSARLAEGMDGPGPMEYYHGFPLIGYNSHLFELGSFNNYTPRLDGTPLHDQLYNGTELPISAIEEDRQTILKAIEQGYLTDPNGTETPIRFHEGIEVVNAFVANLHGLGHVAIGFAMDPLSEQPDLGPGVMVAPATSMRDPTFYWHHESVDQIFRAHRDSLEPYSPSGGELPLTWEGVSIQDLSVIPAEIGSQVPQNELRTFWNFKTFTLPTGLDWLSPDPLPVEICSKHLDYQHFQYNLTVTKSVEAKAEAGTVRILLAPRYRNDGSQFSLEEQRKLFFTLDVFTTNLTTGTNVIIRNSTESAVTIPSRSWLENLESTDNFCGCGWPDHLLLPKGTPKGMTFDLFAMITNGDDDLVDDPEVDAEEDACATATIMCSLLGRDYPDAKPMGYPFDRKPYSDSNGEPLKSLAEFVEPIPNMRAVQVTIAHLE